MSNEVLDVKILRLLEQDARYSRAQIATMLGENEDTIAEAIDRLEKQRVLVNYGALVDWERAGADDAVQALIEVRVTPQQNMGFDAIAARLYRFEEVKTAYLMSGGFDLMLIVEAPTLKQLALFVAEKLSISENVQSCATHFVLRKYKVDGVIVSQPKADSRLVVSP